MDQSRINKTALPASTQLTQGSSREAEPALKSRFLRAMEQRAPTKERSSQNQSVPLYMLLSGAQARPTAAPQAQASSKNEANAELVALLERACSAMYVNERSGTEQRVVLSLDPVLAGAAAEIVRNGTSVRIKLLAQNENAYRTMSEQRFSLMRVLPDDPNRQLEVEVVGVDRPPAGRLMSRTE
jgi:hypothetical protein